VDNLPNLELLESMHEFPGPYVFKVIGSTEGNFIGRVLAAVRSELAESIEPAFSVRKTAGKRHVCVTIEPPVDDGAQVLAIYRRLREVDGLVMLL
jgi:putative lipoic acid-binding regulatory protein